MKPHSLNIIQPCWWFIQWTTHAYYKITLSKYRTLSFVNTVFSSKQSISVLLFWLCFCTLLQRTLSSQIAVMHYGYFGGLSITCQRNELILMESELLGYSLDDDCDPNPLCSVPYTLAKWYCRGKSTCGGMQVERRPLHKRTCGSDFTNCLRVKYQCVSSKLLHLYIIFL